MWLIALAIAASATALVVDLTVFEIGAWKMKHRDIYWFWIVVGLAFVIAAQACVEFLSIRAAGSGIPEMKAILAGVKLPKMLTLRTFFAKSLGMVMMLSSGMSLGKEGPFVHIAGCIANSLPYKQLEKNKTLRH